MKKKTRKKKKKKEREKEREKNGLKGKGLEPKYNKKKTGLNTLYKYEIMWLTVKKTKKVSLSPLSLLSPFCLKICFLSHLI